MPKMSKTKTRTRNETTNRSSVLRKRHALFVAVAAICMIIGAVTVALSRAESYAVSAEAESGTRTANARLASDSTASGSTAVKFASPTQQPTTVEVDIVDFAYSPATLTVKAGTTVKWTNRDSAPHDVVARQSSPNAPDSNLLSKGETYSFTFNVPGTYEYFCTPHASFMDGTVVVTP
jgi:amicyanin